MRSLRPALPSSPRDRAPRIRRLVRTGVLGAAAAAAALTTTVACTAPAGDLSSQLAQLRMCESGGNYAINTGNGFYGAYQFDLGTWRGLGYSGYPNEAAPFVQDAAATTLHAQRGWAPWPGCAAKLGLH